MEKNHIITSKDSKENKRWYMFYTYPRAEKQALEDLNKQGYETYLPLQEKVSYWKNRQKKIVQLPIIPGYIFVNTYGSQIYYITRRPKIARQIALGKEPLYLKDIEIQVLKQMCSLKKDIKLDQGIAPGSKIKILSGPLKNIEGIVLKMKNKDRIGIYIESIDKTLSIDNNTDYTTEPL